MMNLHDHPEEFSEGSGLLGSLPKQRPGPPEGYFGSFADRLKARIEEEELLAQAPGLVSAGKKTPFVVPEGYFELLPGRIMAMLAPAGQSVSSIRPLWPSLLATAAAAVIMLVFLTRGTQPASTELPPLPLLTADELLAMVDIDEDLIIESMHHQDLASLLEDVPIPLGEPASQSAAPMMSPGEPDALFEDVLDNLDEEALDALEAELLQEEPVEDWF